MIDFYIGRFAIYPSDEDSRGSGDSRYLLWLLFPLLPLVLGIYFPSTIPFTSYIKPSTASLFLLSRCPMTVYLLFPVTQITSHLPQLAECVRLKTTSGVSLSSQHLNFIGGVLGIYMCFIIKYRSSLLYCSLKFSPWMRL